MNPGEQQYLDLLEELLERGARKSDRTGTGTLSVFGRQMRFPLGTASRCSPPEAAPEVDRLRAAVVPARRTNVRWLQERGVTIWDEWADENGELGPVYGYQWRHWRTPDGRDIDQIAQVIESLRKKPDSRRQYRERWTRPTSSHGAAALPRAVPVLRRRRPALLPDVPAQRRHVPRSAVQHWPPMRCSR